MQEKHFTIEEFEKYMDTSDLSEEYLQWYGEKVAHLDNCPMCQAVLDKLLQLEAITADDNWSEGLALMAQEEAIRSRLVAQKLLLAGQQGRMRQVIAMLYANQLAPTLWYRNDLLKRTSVARGTSDHANRNSGQGYRLQVDYEETLIRVKVFVERAKAVTVIVQPEGKAEPMTGTAVWSEKDNVAIAEFPVEELAEAYHIYLADAEAQEPKHDICVEDKPVLGGEDTTQQR